MIKHIFSDMDGTILNDEGDITDRNIQIIKQTNIPFTLVSARAPMEMAEVMDKLALNTPQIGFNGGLIFEKIDQEIQVLDSESIELATAQKIIQEVRDKFPQISLSWYSLNNWYTEKHDRGIDLENSYTNLNPEVVTSDDFFTQPNIEVYKLMLIIFEQTAMQEVKQYLLDQPFSGVSIQQSSDTYLEITSDKALKSRGIQFIIDQEKLEPSDLMAFGDGHNDLPMLQMVDNQVVMKNALPDMLENAKFITKSNQEDGVGYALEHILPEL